MRASRRAVAVRELGVAVVESFSRPVFGMVVGDGDCVGGGVLLRRGMGLQGRRTDWKVA